MTRGDLIRPEGRDLDVEHAETSDRLYAYDFDYRMHDYMMRTFEPDLLGVHALELGCYKGAFTRRLSARFDRVTVVEGAPSLLAIAKEQGLPNVVFVGSRFEDFRPEARFDAVFLIHTLEHLDDPVGVLGLIKGWLAPEGRLFVAVPNAYAASRQIAVEMGLVAAPTAVTPGELQHGHRRTYDRAALLDHIARAGLRAVADGGIFFKPFANFQFDALMRSGAVSEDYLEGCFRLGRRHPDLCASLYAVCEA